MKVTLTRGFLGNDRTACQIMRMELDGNAPPTPYAISNALRELSDELDENETAWGDTANAVVLMFDTEKATAWAAAMAVGVIGENRKYPRTAVFMPTPDGDGSVICVAKGDMEHYLPDYLDTERTFPVVDTEEPAGGLSAAAPL